MNNCGSHDDGGHDSGAELYVYVLPTNYYMPVTPSSMNMNHKAKAVVDVAGGSGHGGYNANCGKDNQNPLFQCSQAVHKLELLLDPWCCPYGLWQYSENCHNPHAGYIWTKS